MKLHGLLETDFQFAFARIHFGEKDGKDFSQISFPNLGGMNNDADSTTISENCVDIVFILNGMPCIIHLEKKSGEWSGTLRLDSISLKVDLQITQISDDPGFREAYEIIPEENVARLQAHMEYDRVACDGILRHELGNAEVLAFVQQRGIPVYEDHSFASACDLMRRISQIYHHDGINATHDQEHSGTIAQMRFAEAHNGQTNCRGIAIILSGVLRANGFVANVVECWPSKEDASDIHVVCEVFAEDLGKMVLLDPSNNLIYFIGDTPLSLIELRQAICENREDDISINVEATHNGEEITKIGMLAYMSKNLMLLRKAIISDEKTEITRDNSVSLVSRDLLELRYPASAQFTCNIQEFYTV